MRRRDFVSLVGGAVAAGWPVVTCAQRSPMPVVGFLHVASADAYAPFMDAFRRGLSDAGYVEGRNVTIEYRWAEDDFERLPTLAAELVDRQVAVLFAGGGNVAARAARAATPTIPIVFTSGSDPVKDGLVASLGRPGGNVTGVALITNEVIAKRVELLRELLPSLVTIAVFTDPTSPNSESDLREAQEAARTLGIQVLVFRASREGDYDPTFTTMRGRAQALLVDTSAIFTGRRGHLTALAARHAIPAVYEWREFVTAGGLMSYGASLTDGYRQAGIYAAKILNGARPVDLPVVQSTRVELVVNLKTANALGITIPQPIFARADEVIE